jgi:type I restriction enzyme R subunit
MAKDENLDSDIIQEIIGEYLFTEKKPLRDDIIAAMRERPKLKERGTTAERITKRIMRFVETFINGVVEVKE